MRFSVTQKQRAELESLHDENGHLTPDIIVQASKKKRSHLHDLFHWDDERAAARIGRREIARHLMCSVKILPSEAEGLQCSVKVRKFYGTTGGYRAIGDVLKSNRLRGELLMTAMKELQSFQEKYEMLSELAEVFEAARKVRTKLKRKGKKKKHP